MQQNNNIGVSIAVYHKRLIMVFVLTVIFTTLVVGSVALISLHDQKVMFEEKISVIQKNNKASQDAISSEYNTQIDQLTTQVNTLTDENNKLKEEKNSADSAEFNLIKKYWYIFRDASYDSGMTVDIVKHIDEQCQKLNLNPAIMTSIYDVESDFNVKVDNYEGSSARGLGQVTYGTGKLIWINVLKHSSYSHELSYDPYVNIDITTTLISRNLKAGTNLYDTLNLYSGGGGSWYYNEVVSSAKKNCVSLSNYNYY